MPSARHHETTLRRTRWPAQAPSRRAVDPHEHRSSVGGCGISGGFGADDRDRAAALRHHTRTHRTQQKPADRAAPVGAHDKHLRLFGHLDQRRHRGRTSQLALDRRPCGRATASSAILTACSRNLPALLFLPFRNPARQRNAGETSARWRSPCGPRSAGHFASPPHGLPNRQRRRTRPTRQLRRRCRGGFTVADISVLPRRHRKRYCQRTVVGHEALVPNRMAMDLPSGVDRARAVASSQR